MDPEVPLSAKYAGLRINAVRTNATLDAACTWGKQVTRYDFRRLNAP